MLLQVDNNHIHSNVLLQNKAAVMAVNKRPSPVQESTSMANLLLLVRKHLILPWQFAAMAFTVSMCR
jgi:hypothetical protein